MRRREFLQAAAALPLLPQMSVAARPGRACIMLMLTGGPSQLDTWDMKPDAPREIRGPFRPIRTNVPGIEISEIFPRMARHADKFALVRSVHHEAAAVHDTGLQLMQTGRSFVGEPECPHIGSVAAKLLGSEHAMLPFAIGNTGGNLSHGQTAAFLGAEFEPRLIAEGVIAEGVIAEGVIAAEGFAGSCRAAVRLVEAGTRFVTVNMFDTVFDRVTWDAHGSKPFSTLADYRDTVGPMFDAAYSGLLEDLSQRGLLESTLVVAAGEFGRGPRINPSGGRDHWPQCWTVVLAGGGIQGGQVWGSSDATGSEPRDNPVGPADIVATVCHSMGIPADAAIGGYRVVPEGAHALTGLFGQSI
jgi:uncharacterized protein (DUF1501 family)